MSNLELIEFIAFKMFFAFICGLMVGLERKVNHAPAGFKTQILVCVGSMLFTVLPFLSQSIPDSEDARIIGQIISGIGFLGAGSIIHGKGSVSGLTTAAWIWFTAAIGVIIGLGYGPAATFTTATLVVVIYLVRKIEHKYFPKNLSEPFEDGSIDEQSTDDLKDKKSKIKLVV